MYEHEQQIDQKSEETMGESTSMSLSKKLGIYSSDPVERFWENPCVRTFKDVGKLKQTSKMLALLISRHDNRFPLLSYTAKRLMTYKVCLECCRRCGKNLGFVPDKHRDRRMCLAAVKNDASALRFVPKELFDFEMCEQAVEADRYGDALRYIPEDFLVGKRGRNLCQRAFLHDPMAIAYMPESYLTKDMIRSAVERTRSECVNRCTGKISEADDWPIAHVPERFMSRELVEKSLEVCPSSVRAVPPMFLSEKRYADLIKRDFSNCCNVPEKLPLEESKKDVGDVLSYKAKALDIPYEGGHELEVSSSNQVIFHKFVDDFEDDVDAVCYISDIHICHQIDFAGKSIEEVQKRVERKVKNLIGSLPVDSGTILIAGDVADSVQVARLFYHSLSEHLKEHQHVCTPDNPKAVRHGWKIVALLGNHELWNGDPYGQYPIRSIEELINDYREMLREEGIWLLQNDLLIEYKGEKTYVIDEKMLLEADEADLQRLLNDSNFIMLGGVGFSGLNQIFNSTSGIYGMRVTESGAFAPRISRDEEEIQSARFRLLYEKVLKCAGNHEVIVATHMPMPDWSNDAFNPNWIYINGHTHQNQLVRGEDGTTVLADNQVGYKPKAWHFNAFTFRGLFDPFEGWDDGIHKITHGQYIDFNNGRGITMESFKRKGQIYMLKRCGTYMFFLQYGSLHILNGGRLSKAKNQLRYYYDNLSLYQKRVRQAFEPYYHALNDIAAEVREIGGLGIVHGCIVDIDSLNHIYLNPFDGKLTPYFAWNTTEKYAFDSVLALFEGSPCPPTSLDGKQLESRYKSAAKGGKLLYLTTNEGSGKALATVPTSVLDRSMYEPSRIMRSIQYVLDYNVVRIWNDEVLTLNEHDVIEESGRKLLNE